MFKFIRDAALWAWRERDFLLPIWRKYQSLPGGPPVFDGDKVKAAIIEYEPVVWDIVGKGTPVWRAVAKVIARKIGPRPMTFEEEQAWMNRHGSPG